MLKQTKQEKLYDTVQLARELFIHTLSEGWKVKLDDASQLPQQIAQISFKAAEIFLQEQYEYANSIQPKSES